MGWANLEAGNYEEAEKAFSDALEIHPNWIWGYIKRGYARIHQNKCELALKDQQKARVLIGDWGSELLEACMIYIFDQCDYQDLKDSATKKYFERIDNTNYKDPMAMAWVYAYNENFEESLRWLQIAIDENTTSFYLFTFDIAYPKEILETSHFKQMKHNLNLPQ